MMQALLARPPIRRPRLSALLLTLALALGATGARADVYSEVTQLIRTGQLTAAMDRADRHLAAQPRDPQMRFLKGVIQTETGQTAEALDSFTRLTQDYPDLPEPYNNLAALHASQGRLDQARESLEMAVRLNPNDATAQENLGDVHASLARQAYRKVLQLDGGNTGVAAKLALIQTLLKPASDKAPASAPKQ